MQGLKVGLWEEHNILEKMDQEILGIMARIGGLDLNSEAVSSGKRRMDIHLAMMKLDRTLESLKPASTTKPESPKPGSEVTVKLPKMKLLTFDGQLNIVCSFWSSAFLFNASVIPVHS